MTCSLAFPSLKKDFVTEALLQVRLYRQIHSTLLEKAKHKTFQKPTFTLPYYSLPLKYACQDVETGCYAPGSRSQESRSCFQ